jgi:hypothetical protein
MDTKASNIDDVIETVSAEQANQLRNRGWFLLAIGKGHDDNGETCLTYSLGMKRAALRPHGQPGSNDSPMDAAVTHASAQNAS